MVTGTIFYTHAASHIKSSTPPLIDINDFYQKRTPRL